MKAFYFLILVAGVSPYFAQTSKKNAAASKKQGSCTVTKTEKDPHCPGDMSIVKFTFIGASNHPVKKGVMLVLGRDSLVPPLDPATGTFSIELDPGKHSFQFAVPYWYRVKSDIVDLKPGNATHLKVKFEAIEMIGGR